MISYREVSGASPELGAAYQVIASEMDPEFLEPEECVRARFHEQEHLAEEETRRDRVPEGYRVHMFAALDEDTHAVVGAVYGSFIPRIGTEIRGFGLVSYLAVAHEYRGMGIARRLLEHFLDAIRADASHHTGQAAFALLFEIEKHGKSDMERLVRRLGGHPLDIDFYQPSVREGCREQQMNLWLLPLERQIGSPREAQQLKYPAEFIHRLVTSLFVYEYPGPAEDVFRQDSTPYRALMRSLEGRVEVDFSVDPAF